ncbi:hypothetical protein [Streptomyces sp. NPDC047061]|uniref:hypothetical protein n=1 Tax=Streptomyces sp. NPDC047061 TaxID=3154605 RepID=UPI0033DF918A
MLEEDQCGPTWPTPRPLGLEKHAVKPPEDDLRTDPGDTTYEWWYFDTHLEDGSALVITFYTKPMLAPTLPLTPVIGIDLERPDGTTNERRLTFSPDQFSASGDRCDVRIAANPFSVDLHEVQPGRRREAAGLGRAGPGEHGGGDAHPRRCRRDAPRHRRPQPQLGQRPPQPFLIAKKGRIVVDDAMSVTLNTGGRFTDEHTGKPVDKREVYDRSGPEGHCRLPPGLEQVLVRNNLVNDLKLRTQACTRCPTPGDGGTDHRRRATPGRSHPLELGVSRRRREGHTAHGKPKPARKGTGHRRSRAPL